MVTARPRTTSHHSTTDLRKESARVGRQETRPLRAGAARNCSNAAPAVRRCHRSSAGRYAPWAAGPCARSRAARAVSVAHRHRTLANTAGAEQSTFGPPTAPTPLAILQPRRRRAPRMALRLSRRRGQPVAWLTQRVQAQNQAGHLPGAPASFAHALAAVQFGHFSIDCCSAPYRHYERGELVRNAAKGACPVVSGTAFQVDPRALGQIV